MLFKKKHIQNDRSAEYSTKEEFCQLFNDNKDRLYLLAFLLTADAKKAEQCFVAGLEDAVKGMPVFKDWAHKWARVMIIQNAFRLVKPQMGNNGAAYSVTPSDIADAEMPGRPELNVVTALHPFERFVFVLSVLEQYTDQYCAVSLGCSRREVADARTRALQQIGQAMTPTVEQLLPALA